MTAVGREAVHQLVKDQRPRYTQNQVEREAGHGWKTWGEITLSPHLLPQTPVLPGSGLIGHLTSPTWTVSMAGRPSAYILGVSEAQKTSYVEDTLPTVAMSRLSLM